VSEAQSEGGQTATLPWSRETQGLQDCGSPESLSIIVVVSIFTYQYRATNSISRKDVSFAINPLHSAISDVVHIAINLLEIPFC
jgi:hypothetical protein